MIIEDFDKLRKHIKTVEGKRLAKEFRKRLVRSEKHADKLGLYFDRSLNSGEMSDRLAKKMGLL